MRLAVSCSSGLRFQDRALAPGEEGAPCIRESRNSGVTRPACSHTHKCAPRSTQAGEQSETHHANPAEGVKMTMFSTVTADTDPSAQSSSAGPPSLEPGRPEGAQADPPRCRQQSSGVEGSSLPSSPGLRRGQEPVRPGVLRAAPESLHQQVRGTGAAVLHGLGRGGRVVGGRLTSRGGYRGAPILPLLERTFVRGERIWQRESPSLQGKRLALS